MRYITLYWASISLRTSLIALSLWLLLFWRKPEDLRSKLKKQIARSYGEGCWYAFGSARSGLACFLKTFLNQSDEVIVSAYTCLAVSTGIIATGAVPVYVDIDSDTLSIDESRIWNAVTSRTKAIVVQHTLGNPAPIQEIRHKANEMGLLVIEDAALSLGTRVKDRHVGTFGDAAIFSMELSKTLSCGWGGLLLVNNADLISAMNQAYAMVPEQSRVRSTFDLVQTVISTWCSHPLLVNFPGKYVMWLCWKLGLFRPSTPAVEFKGGIEPNFLRKMGAAQTLLATLQWRRFREVTDECASNYALFADELRALGYTVHSPQDHNVHPIANRVSFLVDKRDDLLKHFRDMHIELGVWFDGPLSPVPTDKIFNYKIGAFPVAERVAKHVVNIPCHNRLTDRDKMNIIQHLRDCTERHS